MDKDVATKMERLCERYQLAEYAVRQARPTQLPTGRALRRVEATVTDALGRLQETRKPSAAALVRLAYVRGLRSSKPGGRLGPDEEQEVAYLETELNLRLDRDEYKAWNAFRDHIRRLRTGEVMERTKANPQVVESVRSSRQPYPLEQHARASVRSVLETAEMAGSLAGVRAGEYDGVANGT